MHRILPFLVALLLLVPGALWSQVVSRPRGSTEALGLTSLAGVSNPNDLDGDGTADDPQACAAVGDRVLLTDIDEEWICVDAGADTWKRVVAPIAFSPCILPPDLAATGLVGIKMPRNATPSKLSCWTDQGTADVQIEVRTASTPNTAGTDLLSAAITCDTDSQETTTFQAQSGAAGDIVADSYANVQIDGTTGLPNTLCIDLRLE